MALYPFSFAFMKKTTWYVYFCFNENRCQMFLCFSFVYSWLLNSKAQWFSCGAKTLHTPVCLCHRRVALIPLEKLHVFMNQKTPDWSKQYMSGCKQFSDSLIIWRTRTIKIRIQNIFRFRFKNGLGFEIQFRLQLIKWVRFWVRSVNSGLTYYESLLLQTVAHK